LLEPLPPSPLAELPSLDPPIPLVTASSLGSIQPERSVTPRHVTLTDVGAEFGSPALELAAKEDASNGAVSCSLAVSGAPESLEWAVAACIVALDSIIHRPIRSANEPACAPLASRIRTAPAVAFSAPENK
jgi:hypothetical protein